jgi:hypothetical protein
MLKTGTVALALLGTLALGVQSAGASTERTLRYYEKSTSFTYIPAGGKPTSKPPSGPPKPGDRIEVSGNLYKGDHKHHAKQVAGTDHTICLFDSGLRAYCDTQAAFGGSMLLVFSVGGDDDFDSKITGGTGRYTGAKGTVHTHSAGDSGTSDITIHLR